MRTYKEEGFNLYYLGWITKDSEFMGYGNFKLGFSPGIINHPKFVKVNNIQIAKKAEGLSKKGVKFE